MPLSRELQNIFFSRANLAVDFYVLGLRWGSGGKIWKKFVFFPSTDYDPLIDISENWFPSFCFILSTEFSTECRGGIAMRTLIIAVARNNNAIAVVRGCAKASINAIKQSLPLLKQSLIERFTTTSDPRSFGSGRFDESSSKRLGYGLLMNRKMWRVVPVVAHDTHQPSHRQPFYPSPSYRQS
jgi:hypothetical protein